MIPETDQWKLEGNCSICRRANYCNKDCTAHKRHREKIIEQAYREVLQEKYPELAKVIDSLPHYGEE